MQRGTSWEDLALATGLKVSSLQQTVSGAGGERFALRRKVEVALGLAVWTDAAEFTARLPMIRRFGADPLTMSQAELERNLRLYIPAEQPLPAQRAARCQLLERCFAEQTAEVAR